MKCTEFPDCDFREAGGIETEDLREFAAFLRQQPADMPALWFSHKDDGAHPGVWLRRGKYRLKHGSFVDPSDLSCYAAQYYESFSSGRHECLQIGRAQAAADAEAANTAGEMLVAIERLAPELAEAEAATAAGAESEAAPQGQPAAEPEPDPEPLIKLLQPDAAFELHGALTRGWHVKLWEADAAEGEEPLVIAVF